MITLGIVGTFSMLRLFHRLPANRITHRSLSTGLISRTVRVESLAEGYNVNRVLAAIKANPAESITVAKDHLLVRFFNEDMAKNCVASGSGTSGAVMKMDDSLSPPLSAVDVATLGRLGTSRSLAMTDIPNNVQKKTSWKFFLSMAVWSLGSSTRPRGRLQHVTWICTMRSRRVLPFLIKFLY